MHLKPSKRKSTVEIETRKEKTNQILSPPPPLRPFLYLSGY